MHPDQLQKLLFTESDPVYKAVPILNPITEDFPLMRTTLIPTLMDVLVRNQAVKNATVGIYEIAPVYRRNSCRLRNFRNRKTALPAFFTASGRITPGPARLKTTTSMT